VTAPDCEDVDETELDRDVVELTVADKVNDVENVATAVAVEVTLLDIDVVSRGDEDEDSVPVTEIVEVTATDELPVAWADAVANVELEDDAVPE
jgi:hypothetical protein